MKHLILIGITVLLVSLSACNKDPELPDDPLAQYNSTYEIIQGEIWDQHCTSCHTAGTSFARQSDLILTADVSYEQLINRTPNNQSAQDDGLVLLGDLGLESVYKSFLWEKINARDVDHYYADHPAYGSIMPLGGEYLTNGELEFIREWIVAGAPKESLVADVVLLNDSTRYEAAPFEVLALPTQGYQFHTGPFDVGANKDRELFSYQKLNNSEPVYIHEVEIVMRPGSHHFILYNFPNDFPSTSLPIEGQIRDVYNQDETYNQSTLYLMQFHQFVTGTQWPKMRYQFPEGVALEVPANSGFDMNSHYANSRNETIVGEVYANLHTKDKVDVQHVAEILQLNHRDFFIPAGETKTVEATFTFDDAVNIFQLFSHAHSHMTSFKVYQVGGDRSGELIYVAFDWEHPPILKLDPPLAIEAGQGLRLETTYINTEDYDLTFGLRSTDEMMILFGAYYK